MSDFWKSDLGEVSGSPEDAFAKMFTHIPDNTCAIARISAFLNKEHNGFQYLEIEWMLTEGDYKGQKVNQKIKCINADSRDKDPAKTRHRALNMLKLIYQLFNIKPKHTNIPTDQDLAMFLGKTAGIKIRETEPNDEGKQYNWVSEVHASQGFKCETGVALVVTTVKQHSNVDSAGREQSALERNKQHLQDLDMLDEEIPF